MLLLLLLLPLLSAQDSGEDQSSPGSTLGVSDVASVWHSSTPSSLISSSEEGAPAGVSGENDLSEADGALGPGVAGTTIITQSSTHIDATTVVLISSTSTTGPESAMATEASSPPPPPSPPPTEPPAPSPTPTPEPGPLSSPRSTMDTGWRTTSPTPKATRVPPTPPPPPSGDVNVVSAASCDFGQYPSTTLCGWQTLPASRSASSPRWRPGAGVATNWIGGPSGDASQSDAPEGGYAFVETSEGAGDREAADSALLLSPEIPASGVQGHCLSFMYSLAGLSASGIRLLLLRNATGRALLRELWYSPQHAAGLGWGSGAEAGAAPGAGWAHGQLLYSEPLPHQLLLEASSVPALEPSRAYRGHVAVDAIALMPGGSCQLACTFAAGLCHWTNAGDDDFDWSMGRGSSSPVTGPSAPADTWVEPPPKQDSGLQGRGLPDDPLLGSDGFLDAEPMKQEEEKQAHPGGYLFIDSSYPRRPGDVARLESEMLSTSDPVFPHCLRFWFHMFGVEVGSLRVLLRTAGPAGSPVWSMSGDAGNAWYRAAVTLAETQPFQVVFEGVVGATGMSDIAIDNVSLDPGPCPVSPQVAGAKVSGSSAASGPARPSPSPSSMPPDCSLEVDECGWKGVAPQGPVGGGAPLGQTPALWARVPVVTLPPSLQRRPHGPGNDLRNDYFLGVRSPPTTGVVATTSTSTLLVSPVITSGRDPLCFAFWYLVHEPARDGGVAAGLGALRVSIREVRRRQSEQEPDSRLPAPIPRTPGSPESPITTWALYNTQGPAWRPARVPLPVNATFTIELEGEWGPGRHSGILAVDDMVMYHSVCPVVPAGAAASPADCSFSRDACGWTNVTYSTKWPAWQLAGDHHRPAKLSDNTYHAPSGYVFFDMFSLSKQIRRARLQSPVLGAGDPLCVSFWFAAFGLGESTRLRVLRLDQDNRLPEITVWQLEARGLDTARPQWIAAQASLPTNSDFSIVLEGEATNGGVAVDDIRVRPGSCQTRPAMASPGSVAASTA